MIDTSREEHYVRFATFEYGVDGTLVETYMCSIRQADIGKCPHVIIAVEHYRDDGTCRCDDESHVEMKEWGYEWREGMWK